MTDRELLELAAKAAGIEQFGEIFADTDSVFGNWNPLTDDGDALRLAVKKQIFTTHYKLFLRFLSEELSLDYKPSTATRRAIVRAAVEIGKDME